MGFLYAIFTCLQRLCEVVPYAVTSKESHPRMVNWPPHFLPTLKSEKPVVRLRSFLNNSVLSCQILAYFLKRGVECHTCEWGPECSAGCKCINKLGAQTYWCVSHHRSCWRTQFYCFITAEGRQINNLHAVLALEVVHSCFYSIFRNICLSVTSEIQILFLTNVLRDSD